MQIGDLDRKIILEKFGYNPLDAFKAGYSHVVPKDRSELEDILKILSEYGVKHLRPLLNSSDENTAINALYVFSELGRNGYPLIDDVMACFKYSDPSARWYILDGLISHISDLSLEYIATCIETASDQSSRVRGKAIEFIAALPIAKIKAAQALMPFSSELRKQHEQGLEMLLMPTEQLINNISSTDIIVNCYIFAKFIKAAHEGKFIEFEASGASVEEAKFIQMKIALKKKIVQKKRKSL